MLDDTCPRRLSVGIVDRCISLEIRLIQKLGLEAYGAVLQISERETEVCIDRACVDDLVGHRVPLLLIV